MSYADLEKRLGKITERKPWITTPKEVVNLMGWNKRSWRIVDEVNELLDKTDLVMEPDFENTHCYAPVIIKKVIKKAEEDIEEQEDLPVETKHIDPVPRVGRLKSAYLRDPEEKTTKLLFVNRETPITEVTTIMLQHNFSQLPILSNNGRKVEGLISWKSIGKALSLKRTINRAYDCKEDVEVVKIDTPLLNVVEKIIKDDVVLVRDSEEVICGIITASDITEQFLFQSEPFFLIEQIEKQIRTLLRSVDIENIKALLDSEKCDKEINDIYDLTFGQYLLAIQNEDFFNKLNIPVDRKSFVNMLESVRTIRNEVMHFNPNGVEDGKEDVILLRNMANFLTELIN